MEGAYTFRLRVADGWGFRTRTIPGLQWKCGTGVRAGFWACAVGLACEPGSAGGRVCLWGSLQVAVEPSVGRPGPPVAFSTCGHLPPNRTSLWTLRENWALTARLLSLLVFLPEDKEVFQKDKRLVRWTRRASLLGALEGSSSEVVATPSPGMN